VRLRAGLDAVACRHCQDANTSLPARNLVATVATVSVLSQLLEGNKCSLQFLCLFPCIISVLLDFLNICGVDNELTFRNSARFIILNIGRTDSR
jgi:hypothetical protein